MFCIVGLGNPGNKYENNRHNVGFQFLDFIIENLQIQNSKLKDQSCDLKFKNNKYCQSDVCEVPSPNTLLLSPNSPTFLLAKPQTFMNNSGQAVKLLTANYSLLTTDLIVVHDDLDIPLGKYKLDFGTGPKLHNGIASIEQYLKTKDFWRIRIGVDNRTSENRIDGEAYVLQDFKQDEKNQLTSVVFPKIQEALGRHISTLRI